MSPEGIFSQLSLKKWWIFLCLQSYNFSFKFILYLPFWIRIRIHKGLEYGSTTHWFQAIIAGREDRQTLADVVSILRNTSNPQVENMIKIIKKWAKDNRVPV